MGTEENKATARRYYGEVLNEGNIGPLSQIAAEDHVEHDPLPGQREGLSGLEDRVQMLRAAFAPKFTLEDVIAEGDRVVVRWTNRGTHVGEFMGMPPTGRPYSIQGIDIHRFQDGKLAEHWHVVDVFGQMQQLGVIPQPEGATV